MKKTEKMMKTLKNELPVVRERFHVKELSLFGSYSRNEQKKNSDVDILVEFAEPVGFFTFLDLEEHLSNLLGVKVDLVSKKALKPNIGKRIMEERIQL